MLCFTHILNNTVKPTLRHQDNIFCTTQPYFINVINISIILYFFNLQMKIITFSTAMSVGKVFTRLYL